MEKWQLAKATYHDKKKNKLWITVIIEDVNNYIEEYEHHNYILCSVEFKDGVPFIGGAIPNGRGLKSVELSEQQKEMVLSAAIEKAKEYLK